MKYALLIYGIEEDWDSAPDDEKQAIHAKYREFGDWLGERGWMRGGDELASSSSATSVRRENGRTVTTDGPYAETKEQLGGILVLEANDLNHAIQLMSKHPGVRLGGPFEIRPADEEVKEAFEARNRAAEA